SPPLNVCVLISGPFVSINMASVFPVFSDAFLIFVIRLRCSSSFPWEKFKRATFIPELINCSNTSIESEAGPMVQTIFVFLIFIPYCILVFIVYYVYCIELFKWIVLLIIYTYSDSQHVPQPKCD